MKVVCLPWVLALAVVVSVPATAQSTTQTQERAVILAAETLRQRQPQVAVHDEGDTVRLVLPADILFQSDGTTLRGEADAILAAVVDVLVRVRTGTILIAGYTDGRGEPADNIRIALRRAEAVLGWLGAKSTINTARMRVVGYADRPVVSETTPDGRVDASAQARNRRVEIIAPAT